ncbi:SixA phosphatase family protein [Persicobacter psychrovividus]|uniref:Phosphoglycerate mutase n=1 Tax=Persicobacter psychrovividus TaxID=387638 RepID=A0ABM7VBJ5_9BACT|nr:phosphoglycerate mutase [Persicobacter psychrovividus]
MKYILITRHAKSSWDFPELDDIDRPLNSRGEKNAMSQGLEIKRLKMIPDKVICSPATRTVATGAIMVDLWHLSQKNISVDEHLFHGRIKDYFKSIEQTDPQHNRLMFIGHEPDLSALISHLTDVDIEHFPTAAYCQIEFPVNSWKELSDGQIKGRITHLKAPRKSTEEMAPGLELPDVE